MVRFAVKIKYSLAVNPNMSKQYSLSSPAVCRVIAYTNGPNQMFQITGMRLSAYDSGCSQAGVWSATNMETKRRGSTVILKQHLIPFRLYCWKTLKIASVNWSRLPPAWRPCTNKNALDHTPRGSASWARIEAAITSVYPEPRFASSNANNPCESMAMRVNSDWHSGHSRDHPPLWDSWELGRPTESTGSGVATVAQGAAPQGTHPAAPLQASGSSPQAISVPHPGRVRRPPAHPARSGGPPAAVSGTSIESVFYVALSRLKAHGVKQWGPATRFGLKLDWQRLGLTW
jgi:hypothetical protein